MASITKMIDQLSKLVGSNRLDELQTNFVKDIAYKTNDGIQANELDKEEVDRVREVWTQVK